MTLVIILKHSDTKWGGGGQNKIFFFFFFFFLGGGGGYQDHTTGAINLKFPKYTFLIRFLCYVLLYHGFFLQQHCMDAIMLNENTLEELPKKIYFSNNYDQPSWAPFHKGL